MYCVSCGKQIADDDAFCPYCGISIQQSNALAGMGTAARVGMAGAAVSTEATGTAAAVGGLGALKIGLIVLAAVTVVGLGAFGAVRISSRSATTQEPPVIDNIIDQEMSEKPAPIDEAPEESAPIDKALEEPTPIDEALEEFIPIDEALEQYRIIISQAGSYEYYEYETNQPWLELVGYRYALVQMQPDDLVPTLLLEREEMDTEISVTFSHALVFQYDPDTKTVRQPAEAIGDGGIRGGLAMAGDGDGILSTYWSGGTGEGSVIRITLDGDSLNRDTCWTGQIFQMPDSITFIEIEWHDISDWSALDSWTVPDPGETADSGILPTDGDRIVLTGTVGTYDYDRIIALQEQPDPNGSNEYSRSMTYRVIVLDTPQTLRLHSGSGENDYFSHDALMISIDHADGMDQYEGQHIIFSIDPANTYWPSDTSLPLGQPITKDIHILD